MYVLIARRWGDSENHSYPVGIYNDIEEAKRDGYIHFVYRGGKYEPEIYEAVEKDEDGISIMKSIYSPDDFRRDIHDGVFKNIKCNFTMGFDSGN
jgi:hypothetical protein